MQVLGIIPARAGSKGVPGKNMKIIAGKPLIGYTIETALQSGIFSTLAVTSDSAHVLNYASEFGVMLHARPAYLATDESPIYDTVIEVLKIAEAENNKTYDAVFLLQPTSPFRETWHLQEALKLLENNADVASVISVTQTADNHPARMYTVEDNFLTSLQPANEQLNRQLLSPVYLRNGSVYITKKEALLNDKKIMCKPALAYIMDEKYHLNIDTHRDMLLAKVILKEIV